MRSSDTWVCHSIWRISFLSPSPWSTHLIFPIFLLLSSTRWAFAYLISRTQPCIHSGFWRLIPFSPRHLILTYPLHLSGSVSAHLHVTTCIEFWFSGRALRVVSLQLFPLLATYINIYLVLLLVLWVCAVFYLFHGLVLRWRFSCITSLFTD